MPDQRYVAQHDPDGTWSVRELESNCPAIILSRLMVAMTEMDAVLTVRKLHASGIFQGPHYAKPIPEHPATSFIATD